MIATFLLLLFAPAAKAEFDNVKLQPTVRLLECPLGFQSRAECKVHERALPSDRVFLVVDVGNAKVGAWDFRLSEPVGAAFHLVVVKARAADGLSSTYSLSLEAGPEGAPYPMANARVEFADSAIPALLTLVSPAYTAGGRQFLAELRVSDFHPKQPYRARKRK